MHTFLIIVQVISAILVVAFILAQPGKTDGLNFISGGVSDTFYSKNKSRTKEAFLIKLTVFFMVIFAVVTVLLNMLKS